MDINNNEMDSIEQQKSENKKNYVLSTYIAIGTALGTTFGIIFGNIGVGIAIGAGIGVAIGSTIKEKGE